MITRSLLTVSMILFTSHLFAQTSVFYDVHLKNGSIIRGKVVELSSEKVKIELDENVVSSFDMSEVEKVVPTEVTPSSIEKAKRSPYVKQKGFFNDTEFRMLLGSGNGDDKFNTAISFQNASGYKVNPYFRVGAGVGVDHYTDYSNTFLTVFGRVAGDMLVNWITPVYFLDEGYGFMVEKDEPGSGTETSGSKGGWMIHAGIGVKFYTSSKASFTVLAGYKVQKSQRDYTYNYNEFDYNEKRTYSRLTFGLGISF